MVLSLASRGFFRVAALFNFAVGIPFLVIPKLAFGLLGVDLSAPSVASLFGVLVIGFGAIYWIIGDWIDQPGLSPVGVLIGVGAVAKLSVFTITVLAWLLGGVSYLLPLLASGDVVFAIGFLRAKSALSRRIGGGAKQWAP